MRRDIFSFSKKFAPLLLFTCLANNARAIDDSMIDVLPTVVVQDNYIVDFDNWGGYNPFWDPNPFFNNAFAQWIGQYSGSSEEAAQLAAMEITKRKASVCTAIVSSNAKSTTSQSDVTSRWLAAQEVFNSMYLEGTLFNWREITGNVVFKIDGKVYNGFVVFYADGYKETWAVNPGFKTSSVKLLDSPMPNSLDGSKPMPKCNVA